VTRILRLALALCGAVGIFAVSACRPRDSLTLPVIGPAPAWKVTDLSGHEVSGASLRGKVVVVDFWATWCGPCVEEIPGYVALQKKYAAKGLVIVGLSVDGAGPELVRKFVAQNGMDYTVAMADDAVVAAFGSFEAIPTTFLLDRAGNIRHHKTGAMAPAEYEKLVRSLL
jgi:thiol-disulfide isomerase/thioredoxin